ncbi:MAG: winged helix-turn-helix domain-containing protein [Archaeoglobaceae archaeon]
MTRKRERLEIIYDILKIIKDHQNSILPTPLLRYSNLSSQSFSEYMDELLEKGFVREVYDDKGKKYISLTDKGFRYLEKYQNIIDFMDEFDI